MLWPAFFNQGRPETNTAVGQVILLPCLGRGRPSCRAYKILGLKTHIRQTYISCLLIKWCHYLVSVNEQIYCLKMLLGCWRLEYCLPRSKCWFFKALSTPSQLDSQWSSPMDSTPIPVEFDQNRSFQEMAHNSGGAWHQPWALFSCWRNCRLRGDLS